MRLCNVSETATLATMSSHMDPYLPLCSHAMTPQAWSCSRRASRTSSMRFTAERNDTDMSSMSAWISAWTSLSCRSSSRMRFSFGSRIALLVER